jgi:aspartyl-tRNA(Asn)/glutamyl-tRNA(Gln) amidotransferase subunit B
VIADSLIDRWRAEMPELPRAKRDRLTERHGITPATAKVVTSHPAVARLFEETAALHGNWVKVANFIQSEVLGDVDTRGLEASLPVTSHQLAELLRLVDDGKISGKQAKDVYAAIARTDRAPTEVVAELGMMQLSDSSAIREACSRVIARNPKQVEQVRAGKSALIGFFVGQVMKETQGAANPQMVNDELKKLLNLP